MPRSQSVREAVDGAGYRARPRRGSADEGGQVKNLTDLVIGGPKSVQANNRWEVREDTLRLPTGHDGPVARTMQVHLSYIDIQRLSGQGDADDVAGRI